MTPPVPPNPETEIGPYFKILGLILVLGLIGLLALHELGDRTWPAIVHGFIVLGFILLILAVIRPPFFLSAFKAVIKALPFTKYQGDKEGGG